MRCFLDTNVVQSVYNFSKNECAVTDRSGDEACGVEHRCVTGTIGQVHVGLGCIKANDLQRMETFWRAVHPEFDRFLTCQHDFCNLCYDGNEESKLTYFILVIIVVVLLVLFSFGSALYFYRRRKSSKPAFDLVDLQMAAGHGAYTEL